ncbi:lymphotoxin-alpha isoform X2 [Brienomyrus brachyistius]|uniref:lymphotoxin-alpha isoform X2 n=1 Tax=Brienomyrus brachyistius TaxID=42636 RepID=UPI0020B37E3F|nr:lymphotoxin-alpha isoform X2 [Brienomyrus brachyistius]
MIRCGNQSHDMCPMAENTTLRVEEDRSLHLLMNHCREMKRQESNLRIATAFVLLGCTLLIFYLNFRQSGPLNFKSEPTEAKALGVVAEQHTASKPAFHLTAALGSVPAKEKYVIWTDKGDTVHIQEFTYDNCTLTVPSSGLYHIYLQMTYKKPEVCNSPRGTIYLGPRVEIWRDSYPKFVSMMAASETLLCKDTIEKSIYTAGIYQLEKGSQLRVQYGAEDLAVQTDHKKMFFGAYLI